jgi:hypothetical protein
MPAEQFDALSPRTAGHGFSLSGWRLVGYYQRIAARLPTLEEADRLDLAPTEPVLTLTGTARTTTTPISRLSITARTDRLEVDYLIEPRAPAFCQRAPIRADCRDCRGAPFAGGCIGALVHAHRRNACRRSGHACLTSR